MSSQVKDSVLNGVVWYLPKFVLPPFAIMSVSLQDTSLADAPAVTLDHQSGPVNDQNLEFSLKYDSSQANPSRDYAISVRIEVEGRLWFTNTWHHGVKLDGSDAQPLYVRVDCVHP